jgi:protein-S-isoprenylcysteine O-methyltransferase Ste14
VVALPIVETLVLTNLSIIFVSLGLYQLYRQLFTSTGRRYDEGLIKTLQIVLGLPALVALVLLLADFDGLDGFSIPLNEEILALGFVLLNTAAVISLWVHLKLGEHWSGDLETQLGHQLVKSGPYRWVRHPLYSSYLGITLGMFLTTGNWLVSGFTFLYFSAVAARSWKEENMLLERLGHNYAQYRNRTGRFLPRLLLSRTQTIEPSIGAE